jgi:hypothetical protein
MIQHADFVAQPQRSARALLVPVGWITHHVGLALLTLALSLVVARFVFRRCFTSGS